MNNTKRFDGKGELYAKARPEYASGLFNYIKNELKIKEGSIFADIGSGTGIFSEQLLSCGYKVFGVEPNDDMRIKAEEKLASKMAFVSVKGTDCNTGLPDESVDCITAAQAFHWFDADGFKSECKRILKPNGRIFLVYNSRDTQADCTQALYEVRKKYCTEFKGFSGGISDEKCKAFFDGNCEIIRYDNAVTYDKTSYINRVLSSSYSLREGDEKYKEYLADAENIFDTFSKDGKLTVPTYTVAYVGKQHLI